MTIDADGALGRDLGRVLTELVYPDEADLYDELIQQRGGSAAGKVDHPLAYGGIEETIQAFSPGMLSIAQAAVAFIAIQFASSIKNLSEAAAREATAAFSARITEWIRSKLRKSPPIKVDDSQAAQLTQLLLGEIKKAGLSADASKMLLDLLVTRMSQKTEPPASGA